MRSDSGGGGRQKHGAGQYMVGSELHDLTPREKEPAGNISHSRKPNTENKDPSSKAPSIPSPRALNTKRTLGPAPPAETKHVSP